jgi:hypothetical protein
MKSHILRSGLVLVALGSVLRAEPLAALSSNGTQLAPQGGTVVLTATASYDNNPAALGWEVVLPPDWSLVGVSGANVPDIAPTKGSTGTMEFAFVTIPAGKAEFALEVAYPPNAAGTTVESSALFRGDGKLTTVRPEPLTITAPASRGRTATRN